MRPKIRALKLWVEGIVRTDVAYLVRGGTLFSIGQAGVTLSGFLLALAFANFLSPESYGTYKFVLAIAAVIGAFSLTGLRSTVVRAVSRGYDGALKAGLIDSLKWGLVMTAISFGLAGYYFYNENFVLGRIFLVIGACLPLFRAVPLSISFLEGKKDFKRQVILNLIQNILPALFLVATILLTDDVLTIVAIFYIANIIVGLCILKYVFNVYKPEGETEEGSLIYGAHLSLMGIIERIAPQLDKILLFHYLGPAQLAVYTFAIAIPQEMQTLNKILKPLVFPKLAAQTLENIKRHLPYKIMLYAIAAVGIMGTYMLLAPYIYKILLPQYTESIPYSQVYALSILTIPIFFLTYTFIAQKRSKELYIQKTVTPVMRFGFSLVLIPFFGIWGAITAELLSLAILGCISVYFFIRMR